MWLYPKFVISIFIIPFFTSCSAKNSPTTPETPLKMYLVEDIIKKVCNISIVSFSNKTSTEKARLLNKIEDMLTKSARALGVHDTKYVDLIMKGVRSKAFEIGQNEAAKKTTDVGQTANAMDKKITETYHFMSNLPENVKESTDINILTYLIQHSENKETGSKKGLRTHEDEINELSKTSARSNNLKKQLLENIMKNIEKLAKNHLNKADTDAERSQILDDIRNKFIKTAASKNYSKAEIKKYADLVTRGIEIVAKRYSYYNIRRIGFESTNNTNIRKDLQSQEVPSKPHVTNNNKLESKDSANKSNSVIHKIDEETAAILNSTCDTILEEACRKIKLPTVRNCISDNREFNILKLCDGVSDCLDSSDEHHCDQQAIETINKTIRLVANIDTSINSHHCYSDLMHKRMLDKQINMLSDVLKLQLTYLGNNSLKGTEKTFRKIYNSDKKNINASIHEAVTVVESLTSTLGLYICHNFEIKNIWSKEDLEQHIHTESQYDSDRKKCKCNGPTCLKACSQGCEQNCFHVYSLSQLECDAISGNHLVPLDKICDGKLDCYDEIDETDCFKDIGLARFEATHMYDYILKEIELKITSIAQEDVRASLQNLHAIVKKLQKLSLDRNPDVLAVKRIRQNCFEELSKVYANALEYVKRNDNELFNIRFFLVTLKERLISALKRSNTGNKKIVSSDDCICKGNKCVLPKCTKSCNRACTAEPLLTRFFCDDNSKQLNNSTPIELVCDGKDNCPNGEDERDCKNDICRKHHLIVLRNKIQKLGKKYLGAALGEAIKLWRLKATATLKVSEENSRPTPDEMYKLLYNILQDLVKTYSIQEDRRDNTPSWRTSTPGHVSSSIPSNLANTRLELYTNKAVSIAFFILLSNIA